MPQAALDGIWPPRVSTEPAYKREAHAGAVAEKVLNRPKIVRNRSASMPRPDRAPELYIVADLFRSQQNFAIRPEYIALHLLSGCRR